jgi:hypothetical protein
VDAGNAGFAGAMGTAVEGAFRLDAMADDLAIAVLAFWGKRVDGAFEAVKIMALTHDGDFQGFVVLVPANFTFMPHTNPPLFGVFVVAAASFAGAFNHAVVFGVHDAFFDEFLAVGLFIVRGERGGGATACAADRFAQFGVGAIARGFRVIDHLAAAGEFAFRAIEVTLNHVSFGPAIDEGDLSSALQDHFASDGAHAAGMFGEPSFLNLIPLHGSS